MKFIPIPKVKNKYLNGIITIIYWCIIGLGLGFILVGIIYLAVILIALIIAWVEKNKVIYYETIRDFDKESKKRSLVLLFHFLFYFHIFLIFRNIYLFHFS